MVLFFLYFFTSYLLLYVLAMFYSWPVESLLQIELLDLSLCLLLIYILFTVNLRAGLFMCKLDIFFGNIKDNQKTVTFLSINLSLNLIKINKCDVLNICIITFHQINRLIIYLHCTAIKQPIYLPNNYYYCKYLRIDQN